MFNLYTLYYVLDHLYNTLKCGTKCYQMYSKDCLGEYKRIAPMLAITLGDDQLRKLLYLRTQQTGYKCADPFKQWKGKWKATSRHRSKRQWRGATRTHPGELCQGCSAIFFAQRLSQCNHVFAKRASFHFCFQDVRDVLLHYPKHARAVPEVASFIETSSAGLGGQRCGTSAKRRHTSRSSGLGQGPNPYRAWWFRSCVA